MAWPRSKLTILSICLTSQAHLELTQSMLLQETFRFQTVEHPTSMLPLTFPKNKCWTYGWRLQPASKKMITSKLGWRMMRQWTPSKQHNLTKITLEAIFPLSKNSKLSTKLSAPQEETTLARNLRCSQLTMIPKICKIASAQAEMQFINLFENRLKLLSNLIKQT